MSRSPEFRLTCCKCRSTIRPNSVYALDEEWHRRYPDMIGNLACRRCATGHYWRCRTTEGDLTPGHLPTTVDDNHFDAWDHVPAWGSQVTMVMADPASGVVQGAREYIAHLAQRRQLHHATAERICDALQRPAAAPSR